MIKPAIVAVGYNRPEGIKRLLESIGRAHFESDDIPLIISIDESNKSDEVEQVAQEFAWTHGTKEIRRYPERQGLRKHIVQCGDLSEKYGGVIILEDDLIVAEDFYSYVCKAHEAYSQHSEVCGVALYSYSYNVFTHYTFMPTPTENDVYLGGMVVTWGQSWTHSQWVNFKDWYLSHEDKLPAINSKIPRDISSWTRSWGKYFASYMAEKNLSYVYPVVARSTCFSDFGEHNKTGLPFTFVQVPLMHGSPKEYHFGDINDLERYDSFYERVLTEDDTVAGIPGNQICMDLNNMKNNAGGKEYVITNQKLPLTKVASFGLTLRPIALNVIENVPGDQLFMYKMNASDNAIRPWDGKRPNYPADLRRLKYEYHDAPWRSLLYYAPREFYARLKDQIKK